MISSDSLIRETRLRFPDCGETALSITPIEKGGSERKFYRLQLTPEKSIVLVSYEPGQTENRRYVEIANFLAAHDVRAPKIYFHDPNEGLIWLEDLGERDLWSYRDASWGKRRPLYESALIESAKLHRITAADSEEMRRDLSPPFDAALYLWEQSYFFEQCLGRHFGLRTEEWRQLAELPVHLR